MSCSRVTLVRFPKLGHGNVWPFWFVMTKSHRQKLYAWEMQLAILATLPKLVHSTAIAVIFIIVSCNAST
jgi:hypothetical protein